MHRLVAVVAALAPLALSACAPASPPASAPTSHEPSRAAAASAPGSTTETEQAPPADVEPPAPQEDAPLVVTCQDDGTICRPPKGFAERLCKSAKPDLALAMFHGSTPWTRAYVRQDMEAWYASARRSRPYQLRYAEEVIVIASRQSGGAVQISGSGSYDVVRWDGTCVSLMEGELSFVRPSTPDVAIIQWRRLDERITSTLAQHPAIAYRNDKRRDACKGFGAADDPRCQLAETMLSRKIAEYVRGGGALPDIGR